MKRYFIYLSAIFLAIIQITVSNRLSNYGQNISILSQKTKAIELDNERLKKKIASESAIINLTLKAKGLGFDQKAEVLYLDDVYSVAQNSPVKVN